MGQALPFFPALVELHRAGIRVVFGRINDAPYVFGDGIVILSVLYTDAAALALLEYRGARASYLGRLERKLT